MRNGEHTALQWLLTDPFSADECAVLFRNTESPKLTIKNDARLISMIGNKLKLCIRFNILISIAELARLLYGVNTGGLR